MSRELPQIVIPFAALVPDNRRLTPGNGRLILAKRYRDARDGVHLIAKVAWKRHEIIGGAVMMECRFWLPVRRKRDMTNFSKILNDALSGVCYFDDEQITHYTMVKCGVDKAKPRVELTLWPYLNGATP